jgi:hypothetical protein
MKGSLRDMRADDLAAIPLRALGYPDPEVHYRVWSARRARSTASAMIGVEQGCSGPDLSLDMPFA